MTKKIFLMLVWLQIILFIGWNVLSLIIVGDIWLIVAFMGGSAIFLLIPSLLLAVWGKRLQQQSDPSTSVRIATYVALAPIFVLLLVMLISMIIFTISPPGVS